MDNAKEFKKVEKQTTIKQDEKNKTEKRRKIMVFIVVPLPFQHKLNYFHFAELLKNYLLFVQIFS